jgi:hypothetical protein
MQHRTGLVSCQTDFGKNIEFKLVIAYILIKDRVMCLIRAYIRVVGEIMMIFYKARPPQDGRSGESVKPSP